jgi:predicted nucleotidyltransferase
MSIVTRLHNQGLIKPPPFVFGGTQYETIMGSQAYGVSSESSDVDIYGFCIPPKDMVFPHLRGEIQGFGDQIQHFEQYQQHHVKEGSTQKEYDLNIYSIVKYFDLCMDNNPNLIDSLFTPQMCVTKATKIAQHVRDNRKLFLHKGAWHRFKGYAYSQMHKMGLKSPQAGSKRRELVEKHGYDIKFAYHIVRLLNEVEQILVEGDLDLQRNNDQLKSIRRGEWTVDQIEQYFAVKEKALETTYAESKLQYKPDQVAIKRVLMECLEEHYGSLEGCVESSDRYKDILREVQKLVSQV